MRRNLTLIEGYSKTEVDLKLQVLGQQIDSKLDKVLAEINLLRNDGSHLKIMIYAILLPVVLANLAIVVSLSFRLH